MEHSVMAIHLRLFVCLRCKISNQTIIEIRDTQINIKKYPPLRLLFHFLLRTGMLLDG